MWTLLRKRPKKNNEREVRVISIASRESKLDAREPEKFIIVRMIARLARGATVACTGLLTSYLGVRFAEDQDILHVPRLSSPLLLGVSSGYVAIGAGSAFFGNCEQVLIKDGFVRGMVLQGYAQKTTWAKKITIRGEDLEPIVKSMMRTEPFNKLTRLQASPNGFKQATYGMVRQTEVYEALMREVTPFARSEKIVADRLRDTLVESAEAAVRRQIYSQQSVFFTTIVATMFVASLVIVGLDHAFPVPPPIHPFRRSDTQEKGAKTQVQGVTVQSTSPVVPVEGSVKILAPEPTNKQGETSL